MWRAGPRVRTPIAVAHTPITNPSSPTRYVEGRAGWLVAWGQGPIGHTLGGPLCLGRGSLQAWLAMIYLVTGFTRRRLTGSLLTRPGHTMSPAVVRQVTCSLKQ